MNNENAVLAMGTTAAGVKDTVMEELLSMRPQTTRERKREQKKGYFEQLTQRGLAENTDDLNRKQIRTQIRKVLRSHLETAPSKFAGKPSRRERKALAKWRGVPFTPLLNN